MTLVRSQGFTPNYTHLMPQVTTQISLLRDSLLPPAVRKHTRVGDKLNHHPHVYGQAIVGGERS